MSDVAQKKAGLRSAALARRRAYGEDARAAASRAIAVRSFALKLATGGVVAGYMPIHGEIDPRPLMQVLADQGAVLALPTVAADGQPLVFRAWREGDALALGPLQIAQPLPDAAMVVPDIVLVPLAAFDRRGHRIGYGAGHYDRTLARLRLQKPVVAVGLAFAVQEVPRVPNEPHDAALDLVLTESDVIDLRSG